MYILRRKLYTLYDDTDSLKRMKDSDILAEEKRKNPGFGGPLLATATGAAVGAGVGGVAGGLAKGLSTPKIMGNGAAVKRGLRGLKSGGKVGALIGSTIGGLSALNKRRGQVTENNAYNKRLGYAQNQAMRRERADWKNNMTQRDGYSY